MKTGLLTPQDWLTAFEEAKKNKNEDPRLLALNYICFLSILIQKSEIALFQNHTNQETWNEICANITNDDFEKAKKENPDLIEAIKAIELVNSINNAFKGETNDTEALKKGVQKQKDAIKKEVFKGCIEESYNLFKADIILCTKHNKIAKKIANLLVEKEEDTKKFKKIWNELLDNLAKVTDSNLKKLYNDKIVGLIDLSKTPDKDSYKKIVNEHSDQFKLDLGEFVKLLTTDEKFVSAKLQNPFYSKEFKTPYLVSFTEATLEGVFQYFITLSYTLNITDNIKEIEEQYYKKLELQKLHNTINNAPKQQEKPKNIVDTNTPLSNTDKDNIKKDETPKPDDIIKQSEPSAGAPQTEDNQPKPQTHEAKVITWNDWYQYLKSGEKDAKDKLKEYIIFLAQIAKSGHTNLLNDHLKSSKYLIKENIDEIFAEAETQYSEALHEIEELKFIHYMNTAFNDIDPAEVLDKDKYIESKASEIETKIKDFDPNMSFYKEFSNDLKAFKELEEQFKDKGEVIAKKAKVNNPKINECYTLLLKRLYEKQDDKEFFNDFATKLHNYIAILTQAIKDNDFDLTKKVIINKRGMFKKKHDFVRESKIKHNTGFSVLKKEHTLEFCFEYLNNIYKGQEALFENIKENNPKDKIAGLREAYQEAVDKACAEEIEKLDLNIIPDKNPDQVPGNKQQAHFKFNRDLIIPMAASSVVTAAWIGLTVYRHFNKAAFTALEKYLPYVGIGSGALVLAATILAKMIRVTTDADIERYVNFARGDDNLNQAKDADHNKKFIVGIITSAVVTAAWSSATIYLYLNKNIASAIPQIKTITNAIPIAGIVTSSLMFAIPLIVGIIENSADNNRTL